MSTIKKNLTHVNHTAQPPSAGQHGAWYVKTAQAVWTRYSDADNNILETQFFKKDNGSNKIRVGVVNGEYAVNLHQLIQYKADDALKQRPLKRILEDGAGGVVATTAVAAVAPAPSKAAVTGAPPPTTAKSSSSSASKIGVWYCQTATSQWTKYSEADNAALEAAFSSTASASNSTVPVCGGSYKVNLTHLTQFKTDDNQRQRPVKRVVEDAPTTSASSLGGLSATTDPMAVAIIRLKKVTPPSTPSKVNSIGGKTSSDTVDAAEAPSIKKTRTASPAKGSAAPPTNMTSSSGGYVPVGAAEATAGIYASRKAEEAAILSKLTDPNGTQIDLSRFANSQFHCIVPKVSPSAPSVTVVVEGNDKQPQFTMPADAALRGHLQLFARLLRRVPLINRSSLADSASKCRPHTKEWLTAIGRLPKFKGVFLMLKTPLQQLDPRMSVQLTPKYVTTVGGLQKMAAETVFTVVGGSQFKRHGSMTDIADPDSVLVPCMNSQKMNPLSDREHLEAQTMLISGPVQMLVDNDFAPVSNPCTFISCSIPGINFAYSEADRKAFLVELKSADGTSGGYGINTFKSLERMRIIWGHTLAVLDSIHEVEVACLCAIGCGAFKGIFGEAVPTLWGMALAMALTHYKYADANGSKFVKCTYDVTPHQNNSSASQTTQAASSRNIGPPSTNGTFAHLRSVVVSLPNFGDSNFLSFSNGFRSQLALIEKSAGALPLQHVPVLLVEDASMTTIATYCATIEKRRVGILNPSDVQAIRHGWVGMYWDGGHVALEELLAMTTTLLVQHVGLDKELYTKADRRFITSL